MFLLFFGSPALTLLYLQCIIPSSPLLQCREQRLAFNHKAVVIWRPEELTCFWKITSLQKIMRRNFFSFSYFDISGLGSPSWQCWEPRLPALRVGLMINPFLSYRAITTFLLVNMDWIADLLCCNKLAFFLHSYIGYSLSKELKRTQRFGGVFCAPLHSL